MNEKDRAEQAEVLRKLIYQIAAALRSPLRPFSFTEHLAQVERDVKEVTEFVQAEIRPTYTNIPYLFAEGVRATRGFENEFNRLKSRVLDYYVDALSEQIPELAKALEAPPLAATKAEMRRETRSYAAKEIMPVIEKFSSAGEDICLQIYAWVWDADTTSLVNRVAETGIGAPESVLATYGMLGLLIDARKAYDAGNVEQAYSYLNDTSFMVGMREGSRGITKHLPELTKKMHQSYLSHKSRAKKREDSVKAVELFCKLRPVNAHGEKIAWDKGIVAAMAIWEVMEKDAHEAGIMPALRFSGLKTLCERLVREEKEGSTLNFEIRWVRVPPDRGSSVFD
ncbi:hypothetical protein GJ697_04135 [Pseudoduganella sp. FT25W]|uniref:Uncharacterized protein n=1 Tax=Duganella alba TaxID=2666081 RepID=A0A6L5QBP5_9BURK|nr:hypothetical protein [Duganella alba]MRX07020.1 hypothetical protein [Duganella alba]MRX16083.1 hypothetical protein [Duganella alba]